MKQKCLVIQRACSEKRRIKRGRTGKQEEEKDLMTITEIKD